jgi:hypothetical protein
VALGQVLLSAMVFATDGGWNQVAPQIATHQGFIGLM